MAEFWASRVEYNQVEDIYEIKGKLIILVRRL